ncbi:MAG: Histone-lysine N-methyltransferase set9 [Phylliscum demangeonii]|nr:MAG: Histone-lysine N-methyltransferase set9 [Phylliscum demangeonii]
MLTKTAAPATKKKEPLTLAQLASYDDVITDALIDQVYFWTQIRKNRAKYAACRGLREEDVGRIVRESVIMAKDVGAAEQQLLQLPGLSRFADRLATDKARDDFRRHLRKYMQLYLPDCAFEVTTTNRFTVVWHEAAVTARRAIRRGETVKYLTGIQVCLTAAEEHDLDLHSGDFSIVRSSRKKSAAVFLGPARFANHDCDPNARLVTSGHQGMEVAAVRDIALGDEITVSYGADYFGLGNRECLCETCERAVRNGWASTASDDESAPSPAADEAASASASAAERETPAAAERAPYAFRRKRKYAAESGSGSGSGTGTGTPTAATVGHDRTSSSSSSAAKRRRTATTPPPPPPSAPSPRAPAVSSSGGRRSARSDTEPGPSSGDAPTLELGRAGRARPPGSSGGGDHAQAALAPTAGWASFPRTPPPAPALVELELELGSSPAPPSSSAGSGPGRRPRRKKAEMMLARAQVQQRALSSAGGVWAGGGRRRGRRPGDYVLTKSLLSEPCSAWVTCTICSKAFVQKDAYYMRAACPRCERHSKLYGYVWPKTDKAGKGDGEERVRDHRTVHRFMQPELERDVRRGKFRGLVRQGGGGGERERGRRAQRRSEEVEEVEEEEEEEEVDDDDDGDVRFEKDRVHDEDDEDDDNRVRVRGEEGEDHDVQGDTDAAAAAEAVEAADAAAAEEERMTTAASPLPAHTSTTTSTSTSTRTPSQARPLTTTTSTSTSTSTPTPSANGDTNNHVTNHVPDNYDKDNPKTKINSFNDLGFVLPPFVGLTTLPPSLGGARWPRPKTYSARRPLPVDDDEEEEEDADADAEADEHEKKEGNDEEGDLEDDDDEEVEVEDAGEGEDEEDDESDTDARRTTSSTTRKTTTSPLRLRR